MITALVVFMAGSAIAASAHTYAAMIVGRSVQGIAGGAITVICEIIVADLVSSPLPTI